MPEKTKKATTLMFILVLALIISNILLISRISNLERTVMNNQSDFAVRNELHSLRSDIWLQINELNERNEQIAQSLRSSFDESVSIERYNYQDASVDATLSFRLREHAGDDAVSIVVAGIDGRIIEAGALYSSGRFSASLTLPVDDDYTVTYSSRGAQVKSGDLMRLNIAEILCERFSYSFGVSHGGTDTQTQNASFFPHLSNWTDGNDALLLNDAVFSIEQGGLVIASWDLMPFMVIEGNSQSTGVFEHSLRENFQLTVGEGSGYLRPDTEAIIRIVMHDNLGVRYEQMDMTSIPGSSNMGGGRGAATVFAPGSLNRVANYGEDVWSFVRIVRQR